MVYPQTPLDVEIRCMFDGSNWTDISEYVQTRDQNGGISIARGRKDWASRTDFGTCTMMIDNRDLRFSPRNPLGPYYGQIGRNTPIQVSVLEGDAYLDLPGGSNDIALTVDAASLDVVGDIDLRVDAILLNWLNADDGLSTTELMSKFDSAAQRSWFLGVRDNLLYFEWSEDGSAVLSASSTASPVPDPHDGLAVRVTLDVDNGAAGNTVTFYTRPTGDLDGTWTQLGDPVTQAGTSSIFASTTSVRVGLPGLAMTPPEGRYNAFQMRDGIDGTIVANPDWTAQAAGTTSFADSAGRTWTLGGNAEITNRKIRFTGEVPEWPIDQDTTGNDIWMEIEAAGRLRRLRSNQPPLQSTLRRRLPTYSPLAYWPMEDGAQSTSAASAVEGVRPLLLTRVDWASADTLVSSDALPVLASSGTDLPAMKGIIPAGPTTGWSIIWVYRLDTANTTLRTYMRINSTGTVKQWLIQIRNDLTRVIGLDGDGATLFTDDTATGSDLFGQWVQVTFWAQQDGADVNWELVFQDVGGDAGAASGTVAGGTVGRPLSVSSPGDGYSADLDGMAMGHLSAWSDISGSIEAYENGITAWSGETAAERLIRVAAEESLPLTVSASIPDTHTVGAQRAQSLYEILQDTADVDGGILFEHREDLRMVYRDRISMYNQTPRLVLDYDTDIVPPLRPRPDDQNTKNDVTVTRTSASSYRVTLDEGPLSVQEHPNGVGQYPDEVTLKLETDAQAASQAGWRLHLGTVDEDRYAEVNVYLQRVPSIIDDVLGVDSGDRIRIDNPPGKFQYDPIDLLVAGYREFINQYRWEFQFLCDPASPWDVAHATGEESVGDVDQNWSWADTAGSELVEALSSTETDVDIITTSGPRWTSDHADSPYLLTVGGETVRVDAPGGFTNTNPYFDADTTGWTAQNSTLARDVSVVHPHPEAVASLKVTPDAAGSANAVSALTGAGTVNPGGQYTASAWIYSPAGYTDIEPQINWHDSGGTYISTSGGAVSAIPAATWTYVERTYTAPATASQASVLVVEADTPAVGDVYYVWAPRMSRYKASVLYDDFGRTSTDTWNAADSSQTWTNTGGAAADYDVLSGYGRHINPAVSVSHYSRTAAVDPDSDTYVDITTAATPTGGALYASLQARHANTSNWYEVRLTFSTANVITLTLRENVAGATADLDTFTLGTAHVAGTFVRVRLQVIGSQLKAKAWRVGFMEPSGWHVEATDTSLTAAGNTAVRSVRDAANTNANAELRFDTLDVVNPQTFTVTRSYNGVVKAQSAAEPVKLRHPAIIAL